MNCVLKTFSIKLTYQHDRYFQDDNKIFIICIIFFVWD